MKNVIQTTLIGFLVCTQIALAAAPEWRQNTTFLPQYCKDRARGMSAFEKWRGTFGDAFQHIHHYCTGIYAENMAKSTVGSQGRDNWLGEVIHQMNYVSSHCRSGCVIYPELHTRWGWALGESGQVGEAIKHYQLAIQAKPNYTPAYAKLSDLYLSIDQQDQARSILEQGLQAVPKSSMLKRRLNNLN
jgi:tetratricopeptide (TPR) repeat protein